MNYLEKMKQVDIMHTHYLQKTVKDRGSLLGTGKGIAAFFSFSQLEHTKC